MVEQAINKTDVKKLIKSLKKKEPVIPNKVLNKKVFKKSEQGTIVFNKDIPKQSKHFKEEVEKARWF